MLKQWYGQSHVSGTPARGGRGRGRGRPRGTGRVSSFLDDDVND